MTVSFLCVESFIWRQLPNTKLLRGDGQRNSSLLPKKLSWTEMKWRVFKTKVLNKTHIFLKIAFHHIDKSEQTEPRCISHELKMCDLFADSLPYAWGLGPPLFRTRKGGQFWKGGGEETKHEDRPGEIKEVLQWGEIFLTHYYLIAILQANLPFSLFRFKHEY